MDIFSFPSILFFFSRVTQAGLIWRRWHMKYTKTVDDYYESIATAQKDDAVAKTS